MLAIPEHVKKCTRGYFGADAAVWLVRLPQLTAEAVDRWQFELGSAPR